MTNLIVDPPIRVLLVEDDEDDYLLTRGLLRDVEGAAFQLEWAQTYAAGLQAVRGGEFDVVLLDYRLGAQTGLDFLGRLPVDEATPPVILLTGQGDRETDLVAMRAGAADYLAKAGLNATMLERSIRYAVERHRAVMAQHDAERRYQLLLESVGAIVWQGDPRTLAFTFVSREAEHLLGYPVARWTTEPTFWVDRIHPEDRDWALALCEDASRRGVAHTFEYRMIAADGRIVWLRDIVRVVESAGRRELAGVMVDVTEVKQAEVTLRLRDRAIAAITEGVLITDPHQPDDPIVYVNPAFEELTGYPASEALGRNCRFLQGPDTDPAAVDVLRAAIAEERSATVDLLNYRRDGTPFWNRLSISPVREPGGRLTHFVGVQRDVTEPRLARLELAAAEAHYRRLVQAAPQAIFALDVEGRLIELNPAGERLLGRSAEELLGQNFGTLVAPRDQAASREAFERTLRGEGDEQEQRVHVLGPAGDQRLLSISTTPIVENGRVLGMHGIARDITEERARERQVRLLASALEGLREQGVSVIDGGRIVYANGAHGRILGYDPEQREGLSVDTFTPDDEAREAIRVAEECVVREGSWSGRMRRRRLNDGVVIPVDVVLGAVQDGARSLLFTIIQDATEKVAREQHLRRVERLAGLGTLIGGVAHELNNPLSAVLGFTRLLLMDPRPEGEREDLETIARETERMAKIVSDLRLIARDTQESAGRRQTVDLNDVVRHVLKTRAYSLRTRNIEVRDDLAQNLPPVQADGGQMEQVLLNLLVNAEQAMTMAPIRRLVVRTRATGQGASLHVVDTGAGIAPEYLDRIFDPFFTTKPPGEGTGLGLSMVHTIVAEHGGEIRVDSEVGKGTAIRIDLPAAARAREDQGAQQAQDPPARRLRVLVVDDEDAVRRVVVRAIQRRGHEVDEATEGSRALELLDGGAVRYDAIVSDLRMPGVSGDELLARLRDRTDGLDRRLVFLTGDTASPEAMRMLSEAGVPILAKPAGVADVVRTVEQVAAALE
ncbi:PAS domain S-box protein [Longimicrobium terrae]|uniref:histidine kinase n=1 Tax=Longimicrobium terrae TaxID=1639882 RepID=A0A841GYI1_9BACT|nr:PAS domain S-box protein [Longimicrobium terrae]MBB4636680.1 PAS domain S-box-containing protein [Longimicrobium terrae]MBB6070796.1 PAS domain S-box-containing protein [Longimicrobium terrae]NNC28822.1 PAS domain S-box protein [Longimicrobium terrae]